MKPYLLVVVGL